MFKFSVYIFYLSVLKKLHYTFLRNKKKKKTIPDADSIIFSKRLDHDKRHPVDPCAYTYT